MTLTAQAEIGSPSRLTPQKPPASTAQTPPLNPHTSTPPATPQAEALLKQPSAVVLRTHPEAFAPQTAASILPPQALPLRTQASAFLLKPQAPTLPAQAFASASDWQAEALAPQKPSRVSLPQVDALAPHPSESDEASAVPVRRVLGTIVAEFSWQVVGRGGGVCAGVVVGVALVDDDVLGGPAEGGDQFSAIWILERGGGVGFGLGLGVTMMLLSMIRAMSIPSILKCTDDVLRID